MTTFAELTVRAASLICSREMVTRVVEPAVADVEHERWVMVRGYATLILVILMGLPRDLVMHRRPSPVDVLRVVTGIAFIGLSPSCGTAPLLRLLSFRSAAEAPDRPRPGDRAA